LPTGILESDEALIMERLAQSDFVFIAADDGVGRGFPYDRQMQTLRPKTRAWCDSHLRLSQQIVLFGRPWRLYCRPPVAAFVPGPE
jgi:hypothetical protein